MAEGSFKRKLKAVFSADVVGYSRLMGADEAATPHQQTAKCLFQDFFRVVKRAHRRPSEERVRPEHRLVKLKAKTVQDLNRLKEETGQASLDDLIARMIRLTDAYRHEWPSELRRLSRLARAWILEESRH